MAIDASQQLRPRELFDDGASIWLNMLRTLLQIHNYYSNYSMLLVILFIYN